MSKSNPNNISVVIAGAGEGIRCKPFTLDFQKPLLEYQNKPIIAHLIDQYKTFSNDIIIANSDDAKGKFLQAWLLDYYDNPSWLKFCPQPPPHSGTNALVVDCLRLTKYQRTLISWSDFILQEDVGQYLKSDNIFFTANITCRFSEVNGCVRKITNNIGYLGLYYFIKQPKPGYHYEDFLENYIGHPIKSQPIKATNLGTIQDLIKNNAFKKSSNRYFNQLEFTDTKVIKTAIDEYGKKIQKLEANWYDRIPDELRSYVPKHQYNPEINQLVLERLNARPISEIPFDQLGEDFWRKKLPDLLNKLHQSAPISVDIQSCVDTYINKSEERLSQVRKTIDAWFDGDRKIINGEDYTDIEMEMPKDLIPNSFSFLHGDLQFSNMMIDNSGNPYMIDGRGYFGKTELYGDPCYDLAKLLYGALDNYHRINEGEFLIGKTNNGTILTHYSNSITKDVKWFIDWAMERYEVSKEKLNYLLMTIWKSLTGYLRNSPKGIIGAYCMGMIRSKYGLIK